MKKLIMSITIALTAIFCAIGQGVSPKATFQVIPGGSTTSNSAYVERINGTADSLSINTATITGKFNFNSQGGLSDFIIGHTTLANIIDNIIQDFPAELAIEIANRIAGDLANSNRLNSVSNYLNSAITSEVIARIAGDLANSDRLNSVSNILTGDISAERLARILGDLQGSNYVNTVSNQLYTSFTADLDDEIAARILGDLQGSNYVNSVSNWLYTSFTADLDDERLARILGDLQGTNYVNSVSNQLHTSFTADLDDEIAARILGDLAGTNYTDFAISNLNYDLTADLDDEIAARIFGDLQGSNYVNTVQSILLNQIAAGNLASTNYTTAVSNALTITIINEIYDRETADIAISNHLNDVERDLHDHVDDKQNPHEVTPALIGAITTNQLIDATAGMLTEESDTLATVTARGATTLDEITAQNFIGGRYGAGAGESANGNNWGAYGINAGESASGIAWGAYGVNAGAAANGNGWGAYGANAGTYASGDYWGAYGVDAGASANGNDWGAYGRTAGVSSNGDYWGAYGVYAGSYASGDYWGAYGRMAGYGADHNNSHAFGHYAGYFARGDSRLYIDVYAAEPAYGVDDAINDRIFGDTDGTLYLGRGEGAPGGAVGGTLRGPWTGGGFASYLAVTNIAAAAVAGSGHAMAETLNNHIINSQNPHNVTVHQIGAITTNQLNNVIAIHTNNVNNPHNVTAEQIGALTNELDVVGMRFYQYGDGTIEPSPEEWFDFNEDTQAIYGFHYNETNEAMKNVIIPYEINNIPVISITSNAFWNTGITNVLGPRNVKTLGTRPETNENQHEYMTFGSNTLLKAVTFLGVTKLLADVFHYSWNLSEVNFPVLEDLGSAAFARTNIGDLDFPQLKNIHNDALAYTPIRSLYIPMVTNIGQRAFYSTTNLTSITLSADMPVIGGWRIITQNGNTTTNRYINLFGTNVQHIVSKQIIYVDNPIAKGYGPTFDSRPVVRPTVYGDSLVINGTNVMNYIDNKADQTNAYTKAEVDPVAFPVATNALAVASTALQPLATNGLLRAEADTLATVTARGATTTAAVTIGTRGTGNVGPMSLAQGEGVVAIRDYSHAEGYSTTASGNYSHAEGYLTAASGNYSHAEGYSTTASGPSSHAEGYSTTASGNYSHAEGYSTTASGNYSHADGRGTIASGHYSHASGFKAYIPGSDPSAFAWQGTDGSFSELQYDSHGPGSYSLNPVGGLAGFWIGEETMASLLDAKSSYLDVTNIAAAAVAGISDFTADKGIYTPIKTIYSTGTNTIITPVPTISAYNLIITNSTTVSFNLSELNFTNKFVSFELNIQITDANFNVILPSSTTITYTDGIPDIVSSVDNTIHYFVIRAYSATDILCNKWWTREPD